MHLRSGAVAIDAGTTLSGFADDIDGQARPQGAAWDIGADESFLSGATTYYRSIGTAADLVNQGTITVTAGSATVTKSGGLGWLAQNRGRGDVLIVNGTDQYMILGVVSDDELALASLPTSSYSGEGRTRSPGSSRRSTTGKAASTVRVAPRLLPPRASTSRRRTQASCSTAAGRSGSPTTTTCSARPSTSMARPRMRPTTSRSPSILETGTTGPPRAVSLSTSPGFRVTPSTFVTTTPGSNGFVITGDGSNASDAHVRVAAIANVDYVISDGPRAQNFIVHRGRDSAQLASG